MKKGHRMLLGGALLPILLLGALVLPRSGQAASLFFGTSTKERKAEIEGLASQAQGVLTQAASLRKNLKDQILPEIQDLDARLGALYDEAGRLQDSGSDDLDEFEMLLLDLEQREQELNAKRTRDRLKNQCEEAEKDFRECEDRFEVHRGAAWNLMFEPDGTEPVTDLTYVYHHSFDPLRDSMQGEHQYLADEKKEFDWMVKDVDTKIDSMRRARRELAKIRDRMKLEGERVKLEAELNRLIDILGNPVLIQNIHSLPELIQKVETLLQDPEGLSPASLSELTQKVEALLQDRQGLSPEMVTQLEGILKRQGVSLTPKMQTVKFFLADGNQFKTMEIAEGEGVPRPEMDPEQDGYEFICWAKKGSDEPFEFGVPLPADVEGLDLYAQFKKLQQQTVRFLLPDGTVQGEVSYTKGAKIPRLPKSPRQDGFRFVGWVDRDGNRIDLKRQADWEQLLAREISELVALFEPVAAPSDDVSEPEVLVEFEPVGVWQQWLGRVSLFARAAPSWIPWSLDVLLLAGWLGLLFLGFRRS